MTQAEFLEGCEELYEDQKRGHISAEVYWMNLAELNQQYFGQWD